MNSPKADTFPRSIMRERSMGPNPLKLCEELLAFGDIPTGSVVRDTRHPSGFGGLVAKHASASSATFNPFDMISSVSFVFRLVVKHPADTVDGRFCSRVNLMGQLMHRMYLYDPARIYN